MNCKNSRLILILTSLFLACSALASNISKIDATFGKGTVRTITEDDNGLLWIVLNTSLFYYDGYKLTKLENATLDKLSIIGAKYQPGGYLWLNSGEGVKRYNIHNGEVDSVTVNKKLYLMPLLIDDKGHVWYEIEKDKVFRITPALTIESVDVTLPTHCDLMNIAAMATADNGDLIFAYCNGFLRYDYQKNEFLPFIPSKVLAKNDTRIREFSQLNNKIYAISLNYLYRYDQTSNQLETLDCGISNAEPKFSQIQVLSDNKIALGSRDGLYLCNLKTKSSIYLEKSASEIYHDHISSFYRSANNTLWIGTRGGLSQYNFNEPSYYHLSEFKGNKGKVSKVTEIEEINEELWLGTNAGILIYDLNFNLLKHINEESEGLWIKSENGQEHRQPPLTGEVFTMTPLSSGVMLLTSGGRINAVNIADKSIINIANEFSPELSALEKITFVEETKQNIWFSSYEQLFRFNKASKSLTTYSEETHPHLKNLLSDTLYWDKKNSLYIGTRQDLIKFDERTNTFTKEGLNKPVFLIESDHNEGLFIASDQLYRYTKEKKLIPITLAGKSFSSGLLASTEKTLWAGNIQTLVAADNKKNELIKVFPKLKTAGFLYNAMRHGKSGRIYVGANDGLFWFKNFQPEPSSYRPSLIVKDFKFDLGFSTLKKDFLLGPSSPKKEIIIPAEEQGLSFVVSALDYQASQLIDYKYRLVGLSDQWIQLDSKERFIRLMNLSPGEYKLQIQSTNNDSVWVDNLLEVDIIKEPFFWQTTSFRISMLIVVILFIMAIIHWQTRRARLRAYQLEQEVNSRTAELVTEKEKVSHLLAVKEEFIANVTHEFKTPLTLILGPTEDLLSQDKNNRQVNMIQRNTSRLLRLVEHLLEFSKPDDSETPKVDDVNHFSRLVLEPFETVCRKKNLSFSYELDDQKILAHAGPDSLEKMITNLVSNAIKYNKDQGSILVKTSFKEQFWVLQVIDSGIGIEAKNQDTIFERFSRLAHEQFERISGAGIGLSLVKALVEKYHGTIDVTSEFGRGSTFTVKLPAEIQTQMSSPSPINSELIALEMEGLEDIRVDVAPTEINATYQVLIVEDNLDMCQHIANSLGNDYECHFAHNGRQGIEKANDMIPDLIISDIMMPEMDGLEFCEKIKTANNTSHIPIVMLTALNSSDIRVKSYENLADDFLTKPFNKNELLARVKSLLDIRKLLQARLSNQIYFPTLVEKSTQEQPKEIPKSDKELNFINQVEKVIEQHYANEDFSAKDLYSSVAMSERQLQRKLKAIAGVTPAEFIRAYRLKRSTLLLKKGMPVNQVSEAVGFSSPTYFTNCFKAQYSIKPSEFRDNHMH
ncbi:hybrid sensor histidine kinase/response regulator transcription factor [Pleionea sediminis]|uniref:hybrid sensor histidine kinase/response regulator transcription factor n=1 Tax=Pleionea sediminis TaxID=2569479 RepID=UPI0011850437|nr:ATP-binding protein [Pleionea sediminis]